MSKSLQLVTVSVLVSLTLAPQLGLAVTTKKTAKSSTKRTATKQKQTVGQLLRKVKDSSRGGLLTEMQKGGTTLPQTQFAFKEQQAVNLGSVKPPRSTEILKYDVGDDQSQYEKTLDQQIQELYKLTQKFAQSSNRGELWLRLAELYVEKSSLVDARKQDAYDAQLKAFQDGKSKKKPRLDLTESREYNKKAIQLYEWYLRDFAKDEKVSQALFFLGYNYFELGDVKKGAAYYEQLTHQYPNSPYIGEAHFALGEYYFEAEQWADAYKEYGTLIKEKKHRLHTFSLYKGGWCLYRLGRTQDAIKYLDVIIKMGRADSGSQLASKKSVNRSRLESEALRDIVVFFADLGDTKKAVNYFSNLSMNDRFSYIEKLAYIYADRGNRDASRDVFHLLIKEDPSSKKAFEYQYQIVQNYFYAKNSPQFKEELYRWINDYNRKSSWNEKYQADTVFIDNVYKLREQTLRNYVLQQHQTAQNSRATYSRQMALDGYQLYFQEFADSTQASDMHFFYGELLYDMGRYEDASAHYTWVAENAPQSKYAAKSAQNLLLAIEKALPKDEELQKRVGDSIEPIPLDPRVEKFLRSADWYTKKFPKSDKDAEIKFRMGRLYYQTNNFGPAEILFKEIAQKHSGTKFAEYSANLLLDIYNLKKDYVGLEKMGTELLSNASIASSKAGTDIRNVLEKSKFKEAQDLEMGKNYLASAEQYQAFAAQNPKSELVSMAMFNAGVNFERSGKNMQAIDNYRKVLASNDKNALNLKPKAKKLLAKLYQDAGLFEESALLFKQLVAENPKDPLVPSYLFNAAAMFEATGKVKEAVQNYTEFIQVNKSTKENRDTLFTIAELLRKANANRAALERYKEYVDMGGNSIQRVEAYYWISQLSRRNSKDADEARSRLLPLYQNLPSDQKPQAAKYIAKIRFEDAERTFADLQSVSIPADPGRQKAAVDRKLELVNKLNEELSAIIKLDSAEEIIASLNLLGEVNDHMAQAILNAPLPSGFSEEQKKQYLAGIEKIAEPFSKKSTESFKVAIERAWDLETYNSAYRNALEKMSLRDPKNYYNKGEMASDNRFVNWLGDK